MFTWVLGRYVASTVLLLSTQTFRRALTGDKQCPFSGVTSSGRVWTDEEAGNRCSECGQTSERFEISAGRLHRQSGGQATVVF